MPGNLQRSGYTYTIYLAPLAVKVGLPQSDALACDVGHFLPGALLVRPLLNLHTTASGNQK
jgi:hypothetical protein